MFKRLLRWCLGFLLLLGGLDCGRHYYTAHYLGALCLDSQILFEPQHRWRPFSGSEYCFLNMQHTESPGSLQELRLTQNFPRFWRVDVWGKEGQWKRQSIAHIAGYLTFYYQGGWCARLDNLHLKKGHFQIPFLRFFVEDVAGQIVYRFSSRHLDLSLTAPALFANDVNCHAVSVQGHLHSFPDASGDLQMQVQYPSAILQGLQNQVMPERKRGRVDSLRRFGQKLFEKYIEAVIPGTSFVLSFQEGRLVRFAPAISARE